MKHKRLYCWISLGLLLFCLACDPVTRDARQMIRQGSQLLDTDPDSTLLLIDSVMRMEAKLSDRERMEMALLQGDALYGGSLCPDDERSIPATVVPLPELYEAAAYYSEKKEFEKAALTALYSGHSNLDAGNKAGAMQSFKAAEQYGNQIGDSLIVARSQYQMGKILYDDGIKDEALTLLYQADQAFGDHFAERAMTQNVMAAVHIMLSNYDTAQHCLDQAIHFAELGGCNEAKRKALNNYAVLYRILGEYEKALDCLRQIYSQSDSTQLPLVYINIGGVFFSSGVQDSAAYYYGLLEKSLPNAIMRDMTKVSAYAALSRFAEQQGDYPKSLELRKEYEKHLYAVQSELEQKRTYSIQKRYDYQFILNMMNKKEAKTQRIYVVVSVVVILLLVALALSFVLLAKKRKIELENHKRMLAYVQQLSEAWTKEEQTMNRVAICMDNKEDKASFEELKRVVFGKKDPWKAMVEVFDKLYPNKRNEIYAKYSGFTEIEYKDILLSYFNVSRQDEALLLKTSIHMVDKIRNNVRKKFRENGEIKEQ